MKLKKLGGLVRPITREARRGVRQLLHSGVLPGVLPLVAGAGRRRCTTTHVQQDFMHEHITLMVTVGGEVEVQEVTSPCADGSHNIVDCAQPLEIVLNDGSYVFNDKYCTNCGEHFPILQSEAQELEPVRSLFSKIAR